MNYHIMVEGDYGRSSRKVKQVSAKSWHIAYEKAQKWCSELELTTNESYEIIECWELEAASL